MLRHNVRFRELQPNVGSFRFALHEKLPLRKQALSSVSSRKILRSHTRIRFDIFQSPPAETRPPAQDTTKCPTPYRPDSECHAPVSSINGNPCTARSISQRNHAPTSQPRTATARTARSLDSAMHRPSKQECSVYNPFDLNIAIHQPPQLTEAPCIARPISAPGITSSRICATYSQIISLEFIDPILTRRLPSFERSPRCGIVSS